METNTSTGSEEEDVPPQKAARLFAGYKRSRHKSNRMNMSVASQYHRYLEVAAEFDHNEKCPNACLHFWLVNKNNLPRLFPLAMRVLSVPASSSPIERVFSHEGIIMRPHRAKLSDKMLSSRIYLKCNSLYMKK